MASESGNIYVLDEGTFGALINHPIARHYRVGECHTALGFLSSRNPIGEILYLLNYEHTKYDRVGDMATAFAGTLGIFATEKPGPSS